MEKSIQARPGEIPQNIRDLKIMPELSGDPQKVIAFGQKAAVALAEVIKSKPKKVIINNEQYLEFEDWQTVARFYGATVGVEWTKKIEKNDKLLGYEARAVVYQDSQIISAAEASCMRDEPKWNTRAKYEWQGIYPNGKKVKIGEESVPEFQLKSMAQTRACAKALRNAFAWVVVLAGFRATPAEEMTNPLEVLDQPPVNEKATEAQLKTIFAITKDLGAKNKEEARKIIKDTITIDVPSFSTLTKKNASIIIEWLKGAVNADKDLEEKELEEAVKEIDKDEPSK